MHAICLLPFVRERAECVAFVAGALGGFHMEAQVVDCLFLPWTTFGIDGQFPQTRLGIPTSHQF